MIEIRDLKKSFNEKHVLKGIDVDVFEDEILAILGPSGQGKTELIKTKGRLL